MAKTPAQMDREIEAEIAKHARYMLVDADTGKDMREAHQIEIDEIQRNRSPKFPEGRATIELGGTPGSRTRPKPYSVTLRLIGVHQPTTMLRTGDLVVRGEYTSDGTHWGAGKGRLVAQRHNGRWQVS